MIAIATWRRFDPAGRRRQRLAHGDVEALLTEILFGQHVEAVAKQEERCGQIRSRLERGDHRRRIPHRDRAERHGDHAARRIFRRHAGVEQDPQRRRPRRRAKPAERVRDPAEQRRRVLARARERERLLEVFLLHGAIGRDQAHRRGDRGLHLVRAVLLQPRQHRQRGRVAHLAERDDRFVLQRAVELGDLADWPGRISRAIVAECLDHRAAEQILAARDQRQKRRPRARIVAVGCDRSRQHRTHELEPLGVQRRQQRLQHCRIRMHREPPVRDDAQAVVRIREHLARDRSRGVAKSSQQHQRAVSDVRVLVRSRRFRQCRNGHRLGRATHGLRRLRAVLEIERAELVDRVVERGFRDRRAARLRGRGTRLRRLTRAHGATRADNRRDHRDADGPKKTASHSTSLSASCRYAA